MTHAGGTRLLHQLAKEYGVQTAYHDVEGRRRPASTDTLVAVLGALGAPLADPTDAAAALGERRRARWQQPMDDVVVARSGAPAAVEIRLPAGLAESPVQCRLLLEDGTGHRWAPRVDRLPNAGVAHVDGATYVTRQVALPSDLPQGYHRLFLEMPGAPREALAVVAPGQVVRRGHRQRGREWGVFMPLYALRSHASWGIGDLADLETLMGWVSSLGGSTVATLPLLPTFLDRPLDPSPYAPVSRLLWNEVYLDVSRLPELAACPRARDIVASSGFQGELQRLSASSLVDHRGVMALKRPVLVELARSFFAEPSSRQDVLWRFVEANPAVESYARFRAVMERRGAPWHTWPEPLRGGTAQEGDYDEATRRYHLYVQWLAHRRMEEVATAGRRLGVSLYLDLPLGVHPDGFDAWWRQGLFASGASAGAPPDAFFTRGQDWGFPPMSPDALRRDGYGYFIACLRHHLRHAGTLRIDHVMGLHRLFWVPRGMEPRQGAYVRYPAEELYAIVALEAQRHGATVAGEDLGTVPPYVRPTMARNGIHRMHVLQYEVSSNGFRVLRRVPANGVASLNTHDMPTFTGFWDGVDVATRREMGLLSDSDAQREKANRLRLKATVADYLRQRGFLRDDGDHPADLMKGALAFLSASAAATVLVNLEDLWLETQPQNVPGTSSERPNWSRKASQGLEELATMPGVVETLRDVCRRRRVTPR